MRRKLVAAVGAFAIFPVVAQAQSPGWYGALSAGYNQATDSNFDTGLGKIDTEFDAGFGVSGAVGYDFGRFFMLGGARVEAEVAYRKNDVDGHSLSGTSLPGSDGDASSFAGMVNVLYDFHSGSLITPYAGGGIGVANVTFNDFGVSGIPNVIDDDDTVFAYQAIVGASLELNARVDLTADYRYFATADPDFKTLSGSSFAQESSADYSNHSVLVGLRYRF